LKIIREGFNQVNSRLIGIQLQIRKGFLDLAELIGHAELDRLASQLDFIGRAFNDNINATLRYHQGYYDPTLREACNAPDNTPEDIFLICTGTRA
jgi:hypothetical protein